MTPCPRCEEMEKILKDIHYCFTNIWALDRRLFEENFMPRINKVLEHFRTGRGKA